MCRKLVYLALVLAVCPAGVAPLYGDYIIWDFENENDHGFTLWSVVPPIPEPDDPEKAGDEALTGGLPDAGVAWTIGPPTMFDGLLPGADPGHARDDANGRLLYSLGTERIATESGTLNTYNLNLHGDFVHTKENDQIATSPKVMLGELSVLTVSSWGGGNDTHAPELDPNPDEGYTTNSAGIAVRSAANDSLLASVFTGGKGTLTEYELDLSDFAGQKVYIEVVDAFEGGWGWLAIDEIMITDAIDLGLVPTGVATLPQPDDEATDVLRDIVLSWTPGEYPMMTHNVYFSTNFDDVNDGVALVSPGQDANSFNPDRLEFGQTYFWRVDEVNAPPDLTVFKGDVWSFTVEPFARAISAGDIIATASSQFNANEGPENTINGSGLDANDLHSDDSKAMWLSSMIGPQPTWIQYEFDRVYKLHQMWVWNHNTSTEPIIGLGIKDATIEYSTDGANWTTLGTTHEFARAPGMPGYAHNTMVDLGGTIAKYVKITANSNWGGMVPQYGLSEVRFFYIPVVAREPGPTSGATDVDVDGVLIWRAGREAATHKVYLSTDEQAVIDETVSAVSIPADSSYTSYGPLSLDLGQTYYWKVNEVNEAATPTTWKGDVWGFATQEYFVVDDFESYNDLDPTDPESNRIFNVWIDGYEVPTNGSLVGYDVAPFAEQTIVHSGKQSMPFFFSNTGGAAYSEAELTLSPAEDWTKHSVKTLSLWFSGDASNTAAQMYVKVNGIEKAVDVDLTAESWQEVNIELASFGADLQRVTSLAISIQGAGSGIIFVDDIRLRP